MYRIAILFAFVTLATVAFGQIPTCIICPNGTSTRPIQEDDSLYVMDLGVERSVSTTPTCSNSVDIALAYYPTTAGQDCTSSNADAKPYSIWFGIKYGECTANQLCGSNCTITDECASKGYTVNEFNQCYNTKGGCGSISSSFIAYPVNATVARFDLYSGSSCAGSVSDTGFLPLDACSAMSGCGYGSGAFINIDDCPTTSSPSSSSPTTTTGQDPSAGSTLESILFF